MKTEAIAKFVKDHKKALTAGLVLTGGVTTAVATTVGTVVGITVLTLPALIVAAVPPAK